MQELSTALADHLNSRHRLLWLAARRSILAVPILIVAPFVTFVLGRLTLTNTQPIGTGGEVQPAQNPAPPTGYGTWLEHVVLGNLGRSSITGSSVSRLLAGEIPVTASLVVGTLLLSLLVGGAVGVVGALRPGIMAGVLEALAVVGYALPVFWLGPVLVIWLAVDLHWLPYLPPHDSIVGWLSAFVLPVITLSFGTTAAIANQMREALLDTLGEQYILMARARGIPTRSIVFRHALKAVLPRVLAVCGVLAAGLVAGALFVEQLFVLPGLGSQLLTSLQQHDLTVVDSIVLLYALLIVTINLVVDLAQAWLNPRISV